MFRRTPHNTVQKSYLSFLYGTKRTPREKAEEALLKCREETYGTPSTLKKQRPPVYPFVGYSEDSQNAGAKAAEKDALLAKERQEKAAKIIEATKRERQALEELREKSPWLFFSSAARAAVEKPRSLSLKPANPSPQRSRHPSFGSVKSLP